MNITEIREDGELVVVTFDDGHRAVFEPYTHGFGYQIEGLRHFFLYYGEQLVCQYNSRLHRCGPSKEEHRVITIADGYTPQRIAEYWRAASNYVDEEYFEKPYREKRKCPEKLWYPWKVIGEGGQDVEMLEEDKTSRI